MAAARVAAPAYADASVWIDGRQGGRGVGQGGDGQAVPGRQRLAVTGRLRPRRAPLQEPAPIADQPRPDVGLGEALALGQLRIGDDPRQDRDPLPVALVGHPVRRLEQAGLVAERVADLGGTPGEGQPLDPVRVGVLAGGERPVVGGQLADHVVERPDRDRAIALVAGERPGVQVDARELRVVVQHLLEMRHEPAGVGRVPVEAAAELVAQPAVGHRVERAPGDGQRPRIAGRDVAAEQVLDGHRLREFRRPAPAAVRGVERGLDGGGGAVEQLGRRVVVPGRESRLVGQALDEPATGRLDLVAPLTPGALDAFEDLREGRDEVETAGARLVQGLADQARLAAGDDDPTTELLDRATAAIEASFDSANGGWGGAPKFPQPMTIEYLLRRHLATGDPRPLAVARRSLDAMADGGLRDQLGGGFHRYSTDARWLVPHFEQMLYDNAQLARVYVHAWRSPATSAISRSPSGRSTTWSAS